MTIMLLGLAAGPLLFILAFLGLAKLVEPGSLVHFVLTCMLVPLVLVVASFAATSPEPTPDQLMLVDAGLAPDPGPASFALWVILFGPTIVAYIVTSVPLFCLLRRRVSQ